VVRNKYNFLNSFWTKTDTDSVRYYRIRIWNRIEKINENRIRMYPLYFHIKFEYRYWYPYWCLNGYGYRIIRISAICFPSLPTVTGWRGTTATSFVLKGCTWTIKRIYMNKKDVHEQLKGFTWTINRYTLFQTILIAFWWLQFIYTTNPKISAFLLMYI